MAAGRQLQVATLVARTFNLVGPGLPDRFLAGSLCAQFRGPETNEVRVGNLSPRRDYVDVRDAVRAYWLLVRCGSPGEVYNVCRGTSTRVHDVVALLSEITGRRPHIVAESTRSRANDPGEMYGSNEKIRAAVGWSPTLSLRESLSDMLSGTAP